MVLLVVLCFLILLFGVFITTPLEIGIEINKTANKNKIYVYLRIFGAPVKIKLKIRLLLKRSRYNLVNKHTAVSVCSTSQEPYRYRV